MQQNATLKVSPVLATWELHINDLCYIKVYWNNVNVIFMFIVDYPLAFW